MLRIVSPGRAAEQFDASIGVTAVTNLISSLSPGTTYHYQLVGVNSGGTNWGGDLTFTTALQSPTVVTRPASDIASTNATLNGIVNPQGGSTTIYYEYGLDTNYGSIGSYQAAGSGSADLPVPFVVNSICGMAGKIWTKTSAPGNSWNSMASSADGMKLAAASYNGIYTSVDGGLNWALCKTSNLIWNAIASSADGLKLAAVTGGSGNWNGDGPDPDSGVYTSVDGGVTWSQTSAPGNNYWFSIASSASGA
jgi:hypothetical protein